MIRHTLLLSLLLLVLCRPVNAQSVLYVTSLADNGAGTLRNQVAAAFPGDTIRFSVTGVITLTSGEINFNKNLVIDGPGITSLTITPSTPGRLFVIGGNVTISKMKLLNGFSSAGIYAGGITYNSGTGSLIVDRVHFENCSADDLGDSPRGGALRADCDSVLIDSCYFINNSAISDKYQTWGGAVYLYAIKQTITNSTFDSNTTYAGADYSNGVYYAYSYGGAMYLYAQNSSEILVENCNFTGNLCYPESLYSAGAYQGRGYAYGGALHIQGAYAQTSSIVRNCTFTNNMADGSGYGSGNKDFSYGGAISLWAQSNSTKVTVLENLTVDNNTAIGLPPDAGIGAIYSIGGGTIMNNVVVTNTTSNNQAVKIDDSDFADVSWCKFSNNNTGGLWMRLIDSSYVRNCLFNANTKSALVLNGMEGYNTTTNCTFTANSSSQGGSAIYVWDCIYDTVKIMNCTMMDDTVTVAGNGLEMLIDNSDWVYLKNNIISTPVFSTDPLVEILVGSAIQSGGGNIVRDGSAAAYLTQPTDMNSANPMLGTFDDHGGPSFTFDLLASSPAIDLGGADTLSIDQRGYLRGALVDAGAYEYNATNPNTPFVTGLSNDTTLCALESATIWVTSNNVPADPIQFQWKLNGTDIGGATNSTLNVSQSTAGTYYYTCELSNGAGTLISDTISVTIAANPTVIASGAATTCAGESTTITASGATSYSWDNGLGAGSSQLVSPTSTTTYVVTGTDGNGCEDTDQVTITVNPLPTVVASGTAAICEGENTTISASGATSYSWDNGLGAGSSQLVSPASTTTYVVTGTDGNGCEDTDQVTITVNPLPTVVASGTASICEGENTTISASGATSYSWDNGLGAGSSQLVSPTSTTTYEVTGTDGNGCEDTDQVTITVNPLPDVSTTVESDQVTITANDPSGSYVWVDCNNGFQSIPGATAQSYTATSNGSYAVIITQNTCTDTSLCVTIDQIGLEELTGDAAMILIPNPSGTYSRISYDGTISGIQISDPAGRHIQVPVDLKTGTIDVSNLPMGDYFVKVTTENGTSVKKLIVVR